MTSSPVPPALPPLRQDLKIMTPEKEKNGAQIWTLYDPLANQYFRVGKTAMAVLKYWDNSPETIVKKAGENGINLPSSGVMATLEFLRQNHLIQVNTPRDIQKLSRHPTRKKKGILHLLLTHYLYFRIPLVHPDRFLEKTLPWVYFLLHPRIRWAIFFVGIWGIVRIMGQWEAFMGGFDYFFNIKGWIGFALTLFFLKTGHELGHAYTAKAMGCKIPTMGLAFMVLYPMLYTDTTDAWRLPKSRQRLAISLAGVKTEIFMALLAGWAWSFLPPGILKSAAFFIAAVGWVGSLLVNLSPFMRFDGYYALADWLGEDNLQSRAFSLARWQIRQWIPGLGSPPPEVLSPKRHTFFVGYALATWIYRFSLFLGIALLVYHATFKIVGILLFGVEILWFILLPLGRELKYWWHHRQAIPLNRYYGLMPLCSIICIGFLFIPWQTKIQIPGILTARDMAFIYPKESGRIRDLYQKRGNKVQKDTPLIHLQQPDIKFEAHQLDIQLTLSQTLLDRSGASEKTRTLGELLEKQRQGYLAAKKDLNEHRNQLILKAPFSGILHILSPLSPGQWCAKDKALAMVFTPNEAIIHAHVSEKDLHLIHPGQRGKFYASDGSGPWIETRVLRIEKRASLDLEDSILASIHGGPIPTRRNPQGGIRPETALYQVVLEASTPAPIWETPGQVRIQCDGCSIAQRLKRQLAGLLIRESGF